MRTKWVPILVCTFVGVAQATPAAAQEDYEAIVRAVRACTGISETEPRVRCYDAAATAQPAGQESARSRTAEAPRPRPDLARGFGAEDLPRPPSSEPDEPAELHTRVVSAAELRPGIYRLALEDGSAWEFVDAVPRTYDAPSRGGEVLIRHGALGSFFLEYRRQRAIRVRRVQ